MDAEKLYNTIEQYLNDELTGQALEDFQTRLKTDRDFANDVALHRSLHSAMGDPEKRKLRASLDLMREEFKNTNPAPLEVPLRTNRFRRNLWIAAASVALLGLTWWSLTKKSASPSDIIANDPTIEQPATPIEEEKEAEDLKVIEPEDVKEEYVQETPKVKESVEPKNTPIEKPPKSEAPKVDYFKENTEIASIIEAGKKQKTHKFEWQIPGANETLTASNGKVNLYFKGELTSFDFPETEQFTFTVFNNQTEAIQKNQAVYSTTLVCTKKPGEYAFGGEDFTYELDKTVELSAGRYYYLVRLGSDPAVLTGGSFLVK